ncbi:potassium channel family protein [Desulfovibrio subterraneus]|uniref:potassium channel family protein n=1 Tax=Desulfovibrio subterraneus TaxID=2718620 RepID=UPI0022B89D9F|nr:potassium channel family protein [Desulfovibrio subterraneus]WBF66463.1 potassium channel family protein [Desulfovibrio subterraneus]
MDFAEAKRRAYAEMRLWQRPFFILFCYLFTACFYSLAYFMHYREFKQLSHSLVDAFYFSMITITTLGYGDITPATELAKCIVASEAILGVIVIGLFLNSLASFYARVREETEKEDTRLKRLWNITKRLDLIEPAAVILLIAMNSMMAKKVKKFTAAELRSITFHVGDLKDLFSPSHFYRAGISTPAVFFYFDCLRKFTAKVDLLVAQDDMSLERERARRIVNLLRKIESTDVEPAFREGHARKLSDGRREADVIRFYLSRVRRDPDSIPLRTVVTPVFILRDQIRLVIELLIELAELSEGVDRKALHQSV